MNLEDTTFWQYVALTGIVLGISSVVSAFSDEGPAERPLGRVALFFVGTVLAISATVWLFDQFEDQEVVAEAAEWKTLRDRYGITEMHFPEREVPEENDEFYLLQSGRVVECRTFTDKLRLFCPVKGDPGAYAEIPARKAESGR